MVLSGKSIRKRRTSSSTSDDLPDPPVPVIPRTGVFVLNGDVQVNECERADVRGNRLFNGNLQVEKNDFARVRNNSATGDIQCFDNGTLNQDGNIAGGNLECDD